MNSLTLRVGSIMTPELTKKNSEMRVEFVKTPERLKIKENSGMERFATAKNIQTQLVVVKDLLKSLDNPATEKDEVNEIIEFLVEIHFETSLKHPIRNTIASGLQQLNQHDLVMRHYIKMAVRQNIANILQSDDLNKVNCLTNSCHGYFENFPKALKILESMPKFMIDVIGQCFSRYRNALKNPLSPGEKNVIHTYVHNSTRLAIACVKQFKKLRTIEGIIVHAMAFMDLDDIPMDTKVNCGAIVANQSEILSAFPNQFFSHTILKYNNSDKRVSLCSGLVTIANESHFAADGYEIIPRVISVLNNESEANSTVQTTMLAISRAYVHLTKSMIGYGFQKMTEAVQEEIQKSLGLLVKFVWAFCQHSLDCIRHLCKDLLTNIIKIGQRHQQRFGIVNEQIIKNAQSGEHCHTVFCLSTMHLCMVLGADYVLGKIPNLLDLLMDHVADDDWTKCYQQFMLSQATGVIGNDEWRRRWIDALVDICKNPKTPESLQKAEDLLSIAIGVKPKYVTEYLLGDKELPMRTRAHVLWTFRNLGSKSTVEDLPGVLDYPFMHSGVIHQDDEVRLKVLKTIVETNMATELFTEQDFQLIIRFMKFNNNCQYPATRQQVIHQLNKMLTRFEKGYIKKTTAASVKDYYLQFLNNYKQILVDSLTTDANFSRRKISLNLLLHTIQLSIQLQVPNIWTKELINRVFNYVLTDTFEENKVLCNKILSLCPKDLLTMDDNLTLSDLDKYIVSIKPQDSTTAAYLIEVFVMGGRIFKDYISGICHCVKILTDGLPTARDSINRASVTNPLYGTLFCIRHLLQKVNLATVKSSEFDGIKSLVTNLVNMCFDVASIVGPIVANDSPEGHLPSEMDCSDEASLIQATPQMVLLCAWRAIKETSLLLGDIVLKAKLGQEESNCILTVVQLLKIGDHFMKLLADTKHRGAFEQAHVGFSKVCIRMWQAGDPQLHTLPLKWLDEIQSDISGVASSNKLCKTRRSAGAPFIVRAIIISEFKVNTSKALKKSLPFLLHQSLKGTAQESRIHALNILCSLFKCTDLGVDIEKYIVDGVQSSVLGFRAIDYEERNAASRLLTALITRIFGVQRTKDSVNLHERNCMTGRIFFLKYARLYDFFSRELATERRSFEATGVDPPALRSLLKFIGRLYPSALEGSDSNMKLSCYVEDISICSGSSKIKTRIKAAKTIASILPVDMMLPRVIFLAEKLLSSHLKCHPDRYHGSLLQIQYILSSNRLPDIQDASSQDEMSKIVVRLIDSWDLFATNYMLLKTFLEIFFELLLRIKGPINDEVTIRRLEQIVFESKFNRGVGFSLVPKPALLLILMISSKSLVPLTSIFLRSMANENIEYIETMLNLLILILEKPHQMEMIHKDLALSKYELDFVKSLPNEVLSELSGSLREAAALRDNLADPELLKLLQPDRTFKLYEVLRHFPNDDTNDSVIRCLELNESSTRGAVLKYCHEVLNKNKMTPSFMFKMTKMLKVDLYPDSDLSLRLGSAKLVATCAQHFQSLVRDISVDRLRNLSIIANFCLMTLEFLRDDDVSVRNISADMVVALTNDNNAVVATYAEHVFVTFLENEFQKMDENSQFLLWLYMSCGLSTMHGVMDENDDYEVFAKTQCNLYAEHLVIVAFCMTKVRELLPKTTDVGGYAHQYLSNDIIAIIQDKLNQLDSLIL